MTWTLRWGGVSRERGYGQPGSFASAEMTHPRRLSD